MTIPLREDHVAAVVDTLTSAGITAYGDVIPDNATVPYCTVVTIPGGGFTGPEAAPNDDGALLVQVNSFDRGQRGANWLRDTAAAALLAGVTVAGRRVHVRLQIAGGTTEDFDTAHRPVWVAQDRFRLNSWG